MVGVEGGGVDDRMRKMEDSHRGGQ
jgi:hypothetical protein